VHVEWQLSLSLQTLLFWSDLRVSLHHDTLGEKLLLSPTSADLLESVLRLVNETGTESAESDLDEGSVEEDLGANIEVGDCLLKMRHQEHVTSAVVLIV
jgi:hypothetical protein